MWWIGQTKNNISNILQLYAFTKKKKEKEKKKRPAKQWKLNKPKLL